MGFLKKLFGSMKKEEDKVDEEFIEEPLENKEEVNDEIINELIERDNENFISVDDNNDVTRVIDKPLEKTDEESLLHVDEVNDEPAQPRNFKYLDDLIHSGVKEIVFDSDIVLDDNEESNYKEGIKLDVDDLIIDGNGYTIDACGKTRIFYCTGKNVSIKNTTLKNGFSKENAGAIYNKGNLTISGSIFNFNKSNWGGAIKNDGSEITIIESVFEENTAIWIGGAINNDGDLKILKSILKDNSTKTGGAIYNSSNLIVTDSILKNNTSESGGAIFGESGKVHIEKTTFAANYATGKYSGGGAIENRDSEMTIIESLLNENMADGEGGAIINYDKLDIVKSIFCENRAQFGGVINNSNELTIIESTFNSNDARKYGGVICNRSKINIEESSFSENRAEEEGGVIFNYNGEISIADSKFNNNWANGGGALYNRKKLDIERCVFDSNYSNNDGSAIANVKGTIEIHGSVFKENTSKNGGCISNNNFMAICDSNFEKNISTSKKYSQDIYNEGIIEFKENNFGEDIPSILNENTMYLNENDVNLTQKIVNNGVFHDTSPLSENQFNFTYLNNLIRGDSEIVLPGDIVLDIFNKEEENFSAGIIIREDNVVIDGNGHSIDAKGKMRVFTLFGNNIVLKNIIIKNGFASDGGGIYKKTGNLKIKNSYLINNVSNNDGGAIFSQGGEIYIEKTTFEYNSAEAHGGSIINNRVLRFDDQGYSSVMCVDSIFKNNVAEYGGAIYNYKTKTEIHGCEFINNRSIENGLNIYQSHSSVLLIENSSFINDLIEMNSIYISDGNCTCKKCKFKFNETHAILIHNRNGILRLIEPIFEDLNNSTNLNSEKLIYNSNILEIFLEDNLKEYIESGHESEIIYLDSYLLSDSKNFTQLNGILKDSYDSYEILLDNDFVLEHPERDFFEGGIELDHQKLILDGQGHTINANGLSRIFLITGGDITLKNIKFENGTCFKNSFNTKIVNGGAINVLYNSSLKIINCEFNNNISQNSAGAIANKWKLALINTKFLNNVAEYDGGSIFNYQNASLDVNNCDFEDNESFSGGTLINEGKCNIDGSNFTGNKSKNGGAIFNNGELSCKNCIFESNKSYEDKIGSKWVGGFGGAIYANSRLILTNTEFNGNNSTDGGALYLKGDCDVEKCIFSENYCERGGAIRNNSNLNIIGCNFKNNHVKIIFPEDDHDLYGTSNEQHFESDLRGASIYNDNAGNIELFDSIFEGYQLDVIYNDGNISLKECRFEEDHKIKNNYGQLNIHENEN